MSVISVVVPAYNSERTVEEVIRRIQQLRIADHEFECIVVDDCSTDATWQKLSALPGITAIHHETNTGKGGAVRTGLERARGDYLVVEDDDMEYDPLEIPDVLRPLLEGRADVVYGSRGLNPDNTYISPLYHYGGKVINLLVGSVLRRRITDSISGTKALTRAAYEQIAPLESQGFGVETEITAKAVRLGLTLVEVPISFRPRSHAEGKNIRWYHAFDLISALLRHSFWRRGPPH